MAANSLGAVHEPRRSKQKGLDCLGEECSDSAHGHTCCQTITFDNLTLALAGHLDCCNIMMQSLCRGTPDASSSLPAVRSVPAATVIAGIAAGKAADAMTESPSSTHAEALSCHRVSYCSSNGLANTAVTLW